MNIGNWLFVFGFIFLVGVPIIAGVITFIKSFGKTCRTIDDIKENGME